MTKKKNKGNHSSFDKKNNLPAENGKKWWWLIAILILTLIIYFPSLKNEFVSLDDDSYVINNPLIAQFDLKMLFTSNWMGNYHPFVLIVYSFIYSIVEDAPFVYHLVNLFIHLFNTAMVFWLIFELIGIFEIAFIVSLFFGIHPMHVESVAWVSELKDLLYSAFFLLSFFYYVKYLKNDLNRKYFVFSLFFFLCSLFSKGMGVSLSIILLLVDYFLNRKLETKLIVEKIPFFLLSLIFGIIAIKAQQDSGAIPTDIYNLSQRVVFACYSFVLYIIKIIAPINLSAFYLYPVKSGENIQAVYYTFPLLVLLIIGIAIYLAKSDKRIFFGVGFFLITILLVLQLIPVGSAMMADRYTYIPSIGIFVIIAMFLHQLDKSYNYRKLAMGLFFLFTIIFSVLAYQRTIVWSNSMSLYNDILKKAEVPMAYGNRGLLFQNVGDLEKSESDFNKAIQLAPNYKEAFINRGNLYMAIGKYDLALLDCNSAIDLDPDNAKVYYNRGNLFYSTGDYNKALIDYEKCISLNPNIAEVYCNQANIFDVDSKYELAISSYTKAIELKPAFALAYSNRSRVFIKLNRLGEACADLKTALRLGYNDAAVTINSICN